MKRGDFYEFHSAPTGEVWTYEFEGGPEDGGICRLRNTRTDGIARVLDRSLFKPDNWPSKSYWKRVEA